jgi:hypothetical protein
MTIGPDEFHWKLMTIGPDEFHRKLMTRFVRMSFIGG